MAGESKWYVKGIKELASEIDRHEKSVREAIDSLQEMKLIIVQKNQNVIWIKQTLTDEELYSRMAFISNLFNKPQSLQELENDLKQEIEWLEGEMEIIEEIAARKEEQNRIRDAVIQKVSSRDIESLVERIFADRTYLTANKTLEERVRDELERFREETFAKYGIRS